MFVLLIPVCISPLNTSVLRLGFSETCNFILKLPLRPWDLSHRVERQKLMVISWEEIFVRVWTGGLVANLLLHEMFGPSHLFETL